MKTTLKLTHYLVVGPGSAVGRLRESDLALSRRTVRMLEVAFGATVSCFRNQFPIEPMFQHLIRVGAMGQIGRFAAVDAVRYPRRSRVIVRTRRGLEIGEVLSLDDDRDSQVDRTDGQILRGMTVEDELLQARLEKHRQGAYDACTSLLSKRRLPAVLVDVEHLFDGQGLYFYFLGDVTPELEAVTSELASAYEAKVQFRKFTETLLEGCGPGCGTEEAKGQGGCASCTSCAVAGACGTKRAS